MLRSNRQQQGQQQAINSGWDTSSDCPSLHHQPFRNEDLCKVDHVDRRPKHESIDPTKFRDNINNNKVVALGIPVNIHVEPSCCDDNSSNISPKLVAPSSASSLSANSTHSASAAMSSRRSALKQSRASSCSSLSTKRSNISFGNVSVHTHKVVLGDNPSVRTGPPLSLDWKTVKSESYNLDDFEQLCKVSSKKPSRIPEATREEWLKQNGHSDDSFRKALQEIDLIKAGRCLTQLDLDPMDEYHVLANVSLRQQSRQARLEAAATAQKKKATRSKSLYSRWKHRRSSAPN